MADHAITTNCALAARPGATFSTVQTAPFLGRRTPGEGLYHTPMGFSTKHPPSSFPRSTAAP
jgi:hypothetical protein